MRGHFLGMFAMNQMIHDRTSGRTIVIVCLLLLAQTSLVRAADSVTGDWEITMEFGGGQSLATLSIGEKADGALTGTWGSAELSNVKFQDGKLITSRGNRKATGKRID